MQSVGILYDADRPTPFWCFFGKLIAKSLFGDEWQLRFLNFVRVRTREFIAFTNASFITEGARFISKVIEV